MKKQVRCLSCNSRLFDVHDDPHAHGIVSIKCRRCGTMSNINLESI